MTAWVRRTAAAVLILLTLNVLDARPLTAGGPGAAPLCRTGEGNSGRALKMWPGQDEEGTWWLRVAGWVRHCRPAVQRPVEDAFAVVTSFDDGTPLLVLTGPWYTKTPMVQDYGKVQLVTYRRMTHACLISGPTTRRRFLDCWRVSPNPADPDGRPIVQGHTTELPPMPREEVSGFGRCGTCW